MKMAKAEPTIPVKFKWAQISPDPHNVTMRNTLEPIETFIEVNVPLKHEYLANSERIIQLQINVGAEKSWKEVSPILTKAGMQYVVNELSLGNSQLEPEVEEEEDWEDATVSNENSEEDWDSTEDDFGDDEDFEDDEEW
jgi:hypothetical protein